jgi:hypothetical protein
MISIDLNENRIPDPDSEFADQLADLIQSWSGRITMGEIIGSLEVHKLQIVIQNTEPEPE